MRLRALRRHWNEYGRSDPLWAILTAPDKKGNRWSIDEFLQTGRVEIDALIGYLDQRGLARNRRRALDFGCGAGRLTHALAGVLRPRDRRRHRCVDDRRGETAARGRPNLEFRVNTSGRLESIASGSVDLVYTLLVLQHIPPRYVREYLADFVRVLTPGGVLIFQLPSGDALPVKVEGTR